MQTKNFRRFLALILSVSLMCGILPLTVLADTDDQSTTQQTITPEEYYLEDGSDTDFHECIAVTANDTVWTDKSSTAGWYVTACLNIDARIEVKGNVNVVLAGNGPLIISSGIHVGPNSSLTVWNGTDGGYHSILITSCNVENAAAIGGNNGEVNGAITINGGRVEAYTACENGQHAGAGIGTGANAVGEPGKITINAHVDYVGARSNKGGAGIGGGYGSNSGTIEINGGEVSASGDAGGAGIGGGTEGICGSITINGGDVRAKGGRYGAGIGSGQLSNSNTDLANQTVIRIKGGSVEASVYTDYENARALIKAAPGKNGGLFYAKYAIYDEAIVKCGNEQYGDREVILDAKKFADYKYIEIDPCSHEDGTRYIPTPDGHKVVCATCRHVIRSESHTDGNNDNVCDICGSVVNATYTVTFDSKGGSDVTSQKIHVNDVAVRPQDPTKAGCVLLGWKLGDTYFDFDTPITEDITLVADWDTAYVATAVSATVIYSAGLQLRFTMRFSDELLADNDAYIKVTKRGQVIRNCKLSQYDSLSADGYQYCISVAPAEWRDYITLEVYDGTDSKVIMRNLDGLERTDDQLQYSVYVYYWNFYDDNSSYDGSYQALVRLGLFYYCRFSQLYFNYKGDIYDNPDSVALEPYSGLEIDDDYRLWKEGNKPEGLKGTSTVLNFKSSNTLRVIFTLEDGKTASDYDFLLKDCEGTTISTTVTPLGNNRYALETNGIDAPNLVKTYTFSIMAKGSSEAYTIHASAMSYAIMAIEKGSSDYMKYLGQSLYMYGYYAHEYFEGDQ